MEYSEKIIDAVDQGHQVNVIYFDYQKAFDKVPHKRLLAKLEAVGVKGQLLTWISNWLIGRNQRVHIEGRYSNWTSTTSSVPQDSVLGPILFLIYINDLKDVVDSTLSMFADDTKLLRVIKDNTVDREVLQADINSMQAWSKKWLMEFNTGKCNTVTFGHGQKHIYTLDGTPLRSSDCEKDVGVLVPSNLKFEEQCCATIAKANSILGQIKRTFNTRDKNVIINAYRTYVLPHLDYCCQIWSPGTKKMVQKIEQVQKRALRLIPSLNHLSYGDKLKNLGMLSLENRRVWFDLITKFKEESLAKDDTEIRTDQRMTRRQANNQLEKPKFRLDLKKNAYKTRVIDSWNSLPKDLRDSRTLYTFKENVKKYLLTTQ